MNDLTELPLGLRYEDDDPAALAARFQAKPDLNAIIRVETASLLSEQYEGLPRWRWFKRWRLRGVAKVLAREEEAYRAGGSADR